MTATKKAAAKKPAAKKAATKKAPAKTAGAPKENSASAVVFNIADEMSRKAKAPAKRSDVIAAAVENGVNPATAATQFGRWREKNGLVQKRA